MKSIFAISLIPAVICIAVGSVACSKTKSVAGAQKPVLLVVSFGTSFNDTRTKTIDAIEKTLADAYPDYEQRRAFTSQIIINKLKQRDGLVIDNVSEAMERLVADGVEELIVQPTLMMNGFEYDDIIAEIKPFAAKFKRIRYGKPLLIADKDYEEFITVITGDTKQFDDGGTAVVFMGHGTEHDANAVYSSLDGRLKEKGFARYFIGTVEAEPDLDEVVAEVSKLNVQRVVLLPLMIVAGDHANNDMAGDEDDSWKTVFESKGYAVTPVLKGLGEYAGVRQIFIRHVREAAAN